MPDDPTEDIMRATYCALCKHGYAELTMQDIADESSKSKAALHYHYDSKHALLLSFLEYLFESFRERVEDAGDGDPADRLLALLDRILTPPDGGVDQEFRTALLEIKAQAPYDDEFRDRIAAFDDHVNDRVRSLVAEGVETDVFRADVDPDETASFIVTVINGAQTRHATVGQPIDRTRRSLAEYVETRLLAADADAEVAAE